MWHRLKEDFRIGGSKWHRLRDLRSGIALCSYGSQEGREMTLLRVDSCEDPPMGDRCMRCDQPESRSRTKRHLDMELAKAVATLRSLVESRTAVGGCYLTIELKTARALLRGLTQ